MTTSTQQTQSTTTSPSKSRDNFAGSANNIREISVSGKATATGLLPGEITRISWVTIARKLSGRWSIAVREVWGIQGVGRYEQRGSKGIVGGGVDLSSALLDAQNKAREAEIDRACLVQALSCAEAAALDALESEAAAG